MNSKDNGEPAMGPRFINPTKKYGLIIPVKPGGPALTLNPAAAKKPVVKPCIFDSDEELEREEVFNEKKHIAQANTNATRLKKETQIEIEKALSQDPSVFEYDEVYEEMETQKAKIDPKANQSQSREPKYIAGLMKAAAKRRLENEKVQERKIQKERELEGDLWGDKETFVTAAYRAKMQERQLLEEEERRQEKIEELLDVRKQRDLSGFYEQLLKMKSGEIVVEEEGERQRRERRERAEQEKASNAASPSPSPKAAKSYRAKKEEESSSSSESETAEKQQEFEFKQPLPKKIRDEEEEFREAAAVAKTEPPVEEEEKKKPKMAREEARRLRLAEIFTKRTVGDRFDLELSEYFTRKANLAAKSYIERE